MPFLHEINNQNDVGSHRVGIQQPLSHFITDSLCRKFNKIDTIQYMKTVIRRTFRVQFAKSINSVQTNSIHFKVPKPLENRAFVFKLFSSETENGVKRVES